MLTFFRRIRKELLGEGSASKYFLYAIGEILLVMIGILLALQVNNWNEERKKEAIEKDLLLGIKENILGNIEYLNAEIQRNRRLMNSAQVALNALDNDLPHHDSLDVHFARSSRIWNISFPRASFETLKSEGLRLIDSKELREQVINLFEKDYISLENFTEKKGDDFSANILFPAFMRNFRLGFGLAVPNNYDSLKDDAEFKNILYHGISTRWEIITKAEVIISESNFVIDRISEELGQTK